MDKQWVKSNLLSWKLKLRPVRKGSLQRVALRLRKAALSPGVTMLGQVGYSVSPEPSPRARAGPICGPRCSESLAMTPLLGVGGRGTAARCASEPVPLSTPVSPLSAGHALLLPGPSPRQHSLRGQLLPCSVLLPNLEQKPWVRVARSQALFQASAQVGTPSGRSLCHRSC